MVDARGGAMKGCRHSGIRVIIPPRRASMPTRITCRFIRKEKLTVPPPLNEGEALAARILELGPQQNKFLGPVIIEIPHYASLRGKEREILILRNDTGEKWIEHAILTTDNAIEDALGCPIEQSIFAETPNAGHSGDESGGDSKQQQQQRLTRIITNDFPKYFALVSRIKQEVHAVNEVGGMISSTVVPKAQAVFPEKALQKKIKLSLQAMPIPQELVAKLLGSRVAVSPIVTIEPRRRKFHKAITLTIPLPRLAHKAQNNSENLRLLCSITGGCAPAQWEDITGHTPLSYIDECASFTTTVSARFWLMDCQNYNEATRMASELYREAIAVPFISRFIVYAKRHENNESKIRIFCVTDDREDKTLETRENFSLIAKTKEIEVLENHQQWLDVSGNLLPLTKSDSLNDQLNFTFQAFKENRLPFVLRIKDLSQHESGRLQLFNDPKTFTPKADVQKQAICTLDIVLPSYNKDIIEAEALKRATLSQTNLTFTNTIVTQQVKAYDININDLADVIDESKLRQLGVELELTNEEINSIENRIELTDQERMNELLHLWKSKSSDSLKLQQALLNINFDVSKLSNLIDGPISFDNKTDATGEFK